MTSFRDAANGLADAFEAGIDHTHPEVISRDEFDALVTRVADLEAGGVVVIPEPENPPTENPPPDPEPPSAEPWEGYTANRVGFATAINVPDQWTRIADGDTASLQSAFAAGQPVELPSGGRYPNAMLRGKGYIKALGAGAVIIGRGTSPIVRFEGDGILHNVLLYGDRSRQSTSEDGLNLDAGNVWCDRVAVANTYDEQCDVWDPGRKRITWTRSAFTQPGVLGLIMGSNNQTRPEVDQWQTFVRCHFETDGRQPLVSRKGAVAHMVNCVHPWWADKYNRAVDVAEGVAIIEGAIVGESSSVRVFLGGGGSWWATDIMHTARATHAANNLSTRPTLPYADIPYEVRSSVEQRRALGRAISLAAGPEIAVKARSV